MKKWRLSFIAVLIALTAVAYTRIENARALEAATDGTFEYVGPEPSTLISARDPNNYDLLPPPYPVPTGCPPGCGLTQPNLCGLRNVAIGLDGKPIITQTIKDQLGAWFGSQVRGSHLCFKN